MRAVEQSKTTALGDRSRVEAVMETLAQLHSQGESLAAVAHDARNMVTALSLYCDLLEEPGVLAEPFRHYGAELRLVASASRRLVEKLVDLDSQGFASRGLEGRGAQALPAALGECGRLGRNARPRRWEPLPDAPIANLAEELAANMNLLAALAGPAITVTLERASAGWPVRLSSEDLTRVLVNLIKNAAEAMPGGGAVRLRLSEEQAHSGGLPTLRLTVEDNGPGFPDGALEKIAGYSSRAGDANYTGPASHRGLGLSITRSIVEAAGGRIRAENLTPSGARIDLELPVRSGQGG